MVCQDKRHFFTNFFQWNCIIKISNPWNRKKLQAQAKNELFSSHLSLCQDACAENRTLKCADECILGIQKSKQTAHFKVR